MVDEIEKENQDQGVALDEEPTQDNAAKSPPSDDMKALEERLADEVRLRQYTEQVLDSRQQELETVESDNVKLVARIDDLRNQLSTIKSQLSEAKEQAKSKDKQLSEARDQIFQLQPHRKDVSEAEAVEAYKILCGNVHRWVENRMKGILDDLDLGRLRSRPTAAQAGRFVAMMRETAKRGLSLEQSDVYHVIAIIMNYLCLVFFSKSFYCPLDDFEGNATLAFIDELETSMSQLPRDPLQCREWRSETLTAVTSQKPFKARKARFIVLATEDLASLLTTIAPKVAITDLHASLRRSIVEPAANLAHQLQTTTSIYSLKWPARGAWSRLEVYECLNLANEGEILDLTGTGPASPARRNVSYLFDVAPGLFVERVSAGKKGPLKAISRPKVLVYDGPGEVKESPTVMKWVWDATAGLPGPSREGAQRPATPALPKRTNGNTQPARRR